MGYGGTKTEMQRLVREAAKLDKSIKANDLSFSNIVKAIHAVQTEMGITGTTAEEAAKTITGAVNSMKAAWKNLLVGIADDNQDFAALIDRFIKSVTTFGANVLPRIKIAFNGIAKLVEQLTPKIIEMLPELLEESMPSLMAGVKSIFESIANSLPELLDIIFDSLPSAIGDLTDVLVILFEDALPKVFESIILALPAVIDALGKSAEKLIPYIASALVKIVKILADNAEPILKAFASVIGSVTDAINQAMKEYSPELIEALFDLVAAVAENLEYILSPLLSTIPSVLQAITETALENIDVIVEGIGKVLAAVIENFPELIETLNSEIVKSGFGGLFKEGSFDFSLRKIVGGDIGIKTIQPYSGAERRAVSYGDINVSVDASGTDATADELAEVLAVRLQEMLEEREAAYGY